MIVRIYDLRKADQDSGRIAKWKSKLQALFPDRIAFSEFKGMSQALWALWSGDPFILIGSPSEIDRYFSRLDPLDKKMMADHAYYWLLTDVSEYRPAGSDRERVERERRPIALNWCHSEQNVVDERLQLMERFPRLRGLSKGMHLLRKDIARIAPGAASPGYSVLILGGSGVGKEEIAFSLFAASRRKEKKMHPVGGAWLKMDPGMALSEVLGIDPGRASGVLEYPGLVELFSEGAVFFDDFESAPMNVQEALLRIMAAPRGQPAAYRRVGSRQDRYTKVWLIFATNASLEKLLATEGLREDILYRFEDRILVAPPLKERLADLPAIARAIWDQLWDHERAELMVPLGLPAIKRMAEGQLEWEGNVRTLRALLGLVVSMRANPAHNSSPPSDLIKIVLSRGKTFRDWLGIVKTSFFRTGESLLERIRNGDAGHSVLGPSRAGEALELNPVPSVAAAKMALNGPTAWDCFGKLVAKAPATKSSSVVRVCVRLARIAAYVAENGSITIAVARELGAATDGDKLSENTALKDLAALANRDLANLKDRKALGPGILLRDAVSGTTYLKNRDFFV